MLEELKTPEYIMTSKKTKKIRSNLLKLIFLAIFFKVNTKNAVINSNNTTLKIEKVEESGSMVKGYKIVKKSMKCNLFDITSNDKLYKLITFSI
ncbi:hypothetical protein R0J90_11950, partial [Micrococcus sp. SIMBA_144]